jgi:catechol 2,3-dioxygenase-like lactoylglutathione lyase family enzyme
MADIHFDHVALLVRDLDRAVTDYRQVLGALGQDTLEVVLVEGAQEGHRYRAATFVTQRGATVLQFLERQHPRDVELLQNKGECVHHLEFCTDDVDGAVASLRAAELPLTSEGAVVSADMPWQRSVVISPKKTHGVLVKVATAYRVEDGRWVARTPPK